MSFWDSFRGKKNSRKSIRKIAHAWDDDYLQIEILHIDNLPFVAPQFDISPVFSKKHLVALGFGEQMEVKFDKSHTIDKEFCVDYLKQSLTSSKLYRYNTVKLDYGLSLHPKNSIYAYGTDGFILFFETDGRFVKNIWIKITQAASETELDIISQGLSYLGEEADFFLVDWCAEQVVDLKNIQQIRRYFE